MAPIANGASLHAHSYHSIAHPITEIYSRRIAQAAGAEFEALYDGLVGLASMLTALREAGQTTDATLVAAENLAWDLVAGADDASMRFAPAKSVIENQCDVWAVGHA